MEVFEIEMDAQNRDIGADHGLSHEGARTAASSPMCRSPAGY